MDLYLGCAIVQCTLAWGLNFSADMPDWFLLWVLLKKFFKNLNLVGWKYWDLSRVLLLFSITKALVIGSFFDYFYKITYGDGKMWLILQKCTYEESFQAHSYFAEAGIFVFTTKTRNTYMFFYITEHVSLGTMLYPHIWAGI